jgi:hypothetical protein
LVLVLVGIAIGFVVTISIVYIAHSIIYLIIGAAVLGA